MSIMTEDGNYLGIKFHCSQWENAFPLASLQNSILVLSIEHLFSATSGFLLFIPQVLMLPDHFLFMEGKKKSFCQPETLPSLAP